MSGEVSKKAGWESFPEGKAHSKMGKQEDKYIKKNPLTVSIVKYHILNVVSV